MFATDDQRITQLRQRSQHYRDLAVGPMAWQIAEQLDRMADECDSEIAQLIARHWRAVS